MYGLVLAAAMTAGASSPELFFRGHGCHGCCGYSSCNGCCGYSSCYGCCGYGIANYSGCSGCYGCYGCYGCSGCSGCCGWGGYTAGYAAVVPGCYGCGGYAMTYPSASVSPAPQMMPGAPAMAPATVVLKTGKDVTVTVDGKPTTLTATETTFSTPALDPSKTYTYVFEAKQTAGEETKTAKKTVTVIAGKETVVDFTKLEADEAKDQTAKVTVILPGEGKLFVNDVEMAIKGKQTFETPKLTPGKRYFYTVKADVVKDGKTSSETRKVTIEAGKSITVDFTPSEVLTASR